MRVRELVDEVPVVGPDDPVLDAVRTMWRQKVPGLVVVDGRGHLMSVLSVTECCVRSFRRTWARTRCWHA